LNFEQVLSLLTLDVRSITELLLLCWRVMWNL